MNDVNGYKLLLFIIIGFLAQIIDGTLGMAYGVSSRTFLMVIAKVPSTVASAIVHVSEVPTTLVSGISHLKMKNVDLKQLIKLTIPGMIGGFIGTWFLSGLGNKLEVLIDIYLIILGIRIINKAYKNGKSLDAIGNKIYPIGFLGGFFDACGGGGWGPIVTSTMISYGNDVKKTIGTVNTAEFLVTIVETTTFMFLVKDLNRYGIMIVAMIIGGIIASPIAAKLVNKIPSKPLMIGVGGLIIFLNIINLINLL